jgi:hypothetical protein
MELAYYFVADNDIELSFFVGFMVSFGIEVIFEVIESGHIRDMFHLIKFMKRMKKSLREYVEFNKDTYPLIRIDEMHLVMREFHMRGFTYQEQVKFYEWLKDNAITLFEDRIVLDKEHIENMFAQYEMSKMQIRRTV